MKHTKKKNKGKRPPPSKTKEAKPTDEQKTKSTPSVDRALIGAMTLRQRKFAELFMELGHAAEAYMKAGYAVSDVEVARSAASRMLTNVNVREYIRVRTTQVFDRLEIKANHVLREIAACAFSNMADYTEIDEAGVVSFKPFNELTLEQLAAVSEITRGENGSIKLKLYSKLDALQKLGENRQLFIKRLDVTSDGERIPIAFLPE